MDELMDKYVELFGEGFPMFQLGRTRTDAEITDILNRCIAEKQDAYALGYVTDDLETFY